MTALGRNDQEQSSRITRQQHVNNLPQVREEISRSKKPGKRQNEYREMQEEHGISEVSQNLPRQLRPVAIVIRQLPEGHVQPSALFAGPEQGQVKLRQPTDRNLLSRRRPLLNAARVNIAVLGQANGPAF